MKNYIDLGRSTTYFLKVTFLKILPSCVFFFNFQLYGTERFSVGSKSTNISIAFSK